MCLAFSCMQFTPEGACAGLVLHRKSHLIYLLKYRKASPTKQASPGCLTGPNRQSLSQTRSKFSGHRGEASYRANIKHHPPCHLNPGINVGLLRRTGYYWILVPKVELISHLSIAETKESKEFPTLKKKKKNHVLSQISKLEPWRH